RQEPLVRRRQMLLARRPRHALDLDAAPRAIDPPQGVDEEDGDAPQRHELEAPGRQAVVAGPLPAAAGADRPTVGPGLHGNLEGQAALTAAESGGTVGKGLVRLHAVEDSLQ